MQTAGSIGWRKLITGYPWFESVGNYPLPAYSEFMPPPRLGRSPYGAVGSTLFSEDDPYGWQVSEVEQAYELNPGLENIAKQILGQLVDVKV